MTKDEWDNLQPGDYLTLLPTSHFATSPNTVIYRVLGKDGYKNGAYRSCYIAKGASFGFRLDHHAHYKKLLREPTLFLLLYTKFYSRGVEASI